MNNKNDIKLSKFLSFVLRHDPSSINLALDQEGWATVENLINCAKNEGIPLDRERLQHIVDTNEKKRFTFSDDGMRIRAAQGHSISVDLKLEPMSPPTILYHGTAEKNLESIFATGLKPGHRQKVHLSLNIPTAIKVGMRHGKPVVIEVSSAEMHSNGISFWRADNGVWLTDNVPVKFLRLLSKEESQQ